MLRLLKPGFLTLAMACAGSGGVRAPDVAIPETPPTVQPPATASRIPAIWKVSSPLSSAAFRSDVTASITLQGEIPTPDTVATSTIFSVEVASNQSNYRIAGTIEAFPSTTGNHITREENTPGPLSFSGLMSPSGFKLDSAGNQSLETLTICQHSALSRLPAVRNALISFPAELRVGSSWSDSSTITACSGTIPVKLTLVREFAVAGPGGQPLTVLISHQDRISVTGNGIQGQHRVAIEAVGRGRGQLIMNPSNGLLESAENTSTSELRISTSGQVHRFTQSTREIISRLR